MPAAVIAGRVDGAVLDQGIYPTLGKPGDPIRVVAHAYDAVALTFAIGVWFTTTDFVSKHPVETRDFANAITTAATWANGHHHESAVILARAMSASVDQIDASARYTYGTAMTPSLIQPSIDVAAKYSMIKARFPARELIGVPA